LRLTKEQAEENRQLIIETASRMFRLHGMENVSVGDIMKESGFTHGGFTTTLNPKMRWRLKLLLLHSMVSQVIYRRSLHPQNKHNNRFHRSSRSILVLRIATLNMEDAQPQPCPAMPREMEKLFNPLSSKALKPISI
jgi:hypothetical protein